MTARGPTELESPTRAQRTIARRAAEARATIPDFQLGAEISMNRAVSLCERGSCSLTALLTRACGVALREHPRANAAYRDGRFELYSRVNVGVVMPSEGDLVAATVSDADLKTLSELTGALAELRGRADSLTPPERSGATFTLTHHDAAGVAWEMPLVWPGQAAAAAAGAIREGPALRGREVVAGRVMTLVLACDHRILYGVLATRFLARIKELLEHGPL